MKKLRPEFVAAMAQTIQASSPNCELTYDTIRECCEQGIKRLESAANDPKNGNAQSVLIFVDYDLDGKLGMCFFNARIKEDFYEDSAPAPVKKLAAKNLKILCREPTNTLRSRTRLSKNTESSFLCIPRPPGRFGKNCSTKGKASAGRPRTTLRFRGSFLPGLNI